ncbi:MAG TPA: tRNA 2-thiouridine(34) synthase MnmA, partial [Atribacterota bacterium]|nr:tRNA 2-thiouridine(34) synthase MnmA [Atribacterota bacterium]
MKKSNRVLVALSGGIDSSVAAFLLKEKGYQVAGLYLHLIEDPKNSTLSDSRVRAQEVASKLALPLYQIDYREDFCRIIIKDFMEQYRRGLTPNPCIFCNEKVKFRLLYDFAFKEGFDYIATGHYVRVKKEGQEDRYLLKRGIDRKKDQSYFLYRIKESILSKCIFPLGDLKKEDTRKIAGNIELPDYIKGESQEICFIPGNDYRKLL